VSDEKLMCSQLPTHHLRFLVPIEMAFVGAGFFMARADFLVDVPFDPFLAWMFM
jgi:Glycosyltransferase (GlcNAc)